MKIKELTEKLNNKSLEDLSYHGYSLVDEHSKAGYNLYLIKVSQAVAMAVGTSYQLGLDKEGTSCTDHSQQFQKCIEKGETVPLNELGPFLSIIKTWVEKYGDIAIASANPEKTERYGKIIGKRLSSLTVEQRTAHGHNFLVIKN